MKKATSFWTLFGLLLAVLLGCDQPEGVAALQGQASWQALPSCQWCGATEAPEKLSWAGDSQYRS